MDFKERKINSETIYDGKVVKLVKDEVLCPNGNKSYREIVRHNGGAGVLCITPDNKVLLIKQFRYAYDEMLYEIPAGKLEAGEDPKLAAIRELEEETGMKASNVELLTEMYPTCGYSAERIYIYLALDCIKTQTNLDEDEFIIEEYIDFDKALDMVNDGTIKDAKTICALMTYLIRYKR